MIFKLKLRLNIILVLSILFTLTSCGKRTIINETYNFENGTWNRFKPVEYKANIKKIDDPYIISVTLRYDTNIMYAKELPLIVDFFPDSNERHNIMPRIRLRDKNGALRGETIGNYCIVTDTIDRRRYYNRPATYTYRLRQRTNKYDIQGITSVQLKIER